MHDSWKKIVLATTLALPLSGCGSFLGIHLFARAPNKAAPMVARDSVSDPVTRTARDALSAGRPGEAIEKFQKALANGEPIAPALNGMAVAYSRIGRLDLAERFFREAISVDPVDQRYQTNLAALMQSPAYTAQDRVMMASAETPPAQAPQETMPQAGQLQRISLHEVRIISPQAYSAPFATRLAKVESAAKRSPANGRAGANHQVKAE